MKTLTKPILLLILAAVDATIISYAVCRDPRSESEQDQLKRGLLVSIPSGLTEYSVFKSPGTMGVTADKLTVITEIFTKIRKNKPRIDFT